MSVSAYLGKSAAPDTITVHPELYYSYDGTNLLGDYSAANQTVAIGTNLMQWVVSFPTITATNAAGFYIVRRFKVGTPYHSPTVNFYMGGTTDSHIAVSQPGSGAGDFMADGSVSATGDWNMGGNAITNAGAGAFTTSLSLDGSGVWTSGNDGSGSGLEAPAAGISGNIDVARTTNALYTTGITSLKLLGGAGGIILTTDGTNLLGATF